MGEEGEEEDGAAAAKGNLRADRIPGLGEGGSWGDWAGTAAGLSGGCSPLGSLCPPLHALSHPLGPAPRWLSLPCRNLPRGRGTEIAAQLSREPARAPPSPHGSGRPWSQRGN